MSSSSSLEYARPHSHRPPTGRIGAYKAKNNIKSAASRDTTSKPHRIVADSLNNVPEAVNNHLPEPPSLKRTIQRKRKIDTVTANPDLALACDRSLLLLQIPQTTDSNLDFLCQSLRWCGDGTFKAAPKLWTQLYTLHGQKNGYTVPCVYALLPNKRKETYIRLFRQVKSWVGVGNRQWIFETFLSDYEQGAFKAMLEVFPDIGKDGCFFHLYKRLDFQVKELGLMPKYRQDDAFKLRVKKLAALAFIPVSDLVATFESLSTSFLSDELRLLAYFENTLIGQPVGGRRLVVLLTLIIH